MIIWWVDVSVFILFVMIILVLNMLVCGYEQFVLKLIELKVDLFLKRKDMLGVLRDMICNEMLK